MRLDVYLSENNFCDSRNKASALIRDGKVSVNGKIIKKTSFDITDDADIVIDKSVFQYVARSAKKLITAIDMFGLNLKGKVAVDIGSSTGGFCEVMLEHGVGHIYAVDIGTNQLNEKLRCRNEITVRENTNARYISADDFDRQIDFVTSDLSFISVKLVLQNVFDILKTNGEYVCLVKPQFEAGPSFIGKNGVVKDKRAQIMCVNDVVDFACLIGFSVYNICFSGLEGESGNREFLLYMKKDGLHFKLDPRKISDTVLGSSL